MAFGFGGGGGALGGGVLGGGGGFFTGAGVDIFAANQGGGGGGGGGGNGRFQQILDQIEQQVNPQAKLAQKRAGGIFEGLGGVADTLGGIASGENDPRFAAFREAQLGQVEQQRERQRADLQRRGISGSALENELAKFDAVARNTSANIGLQELGRQDQALLNQAGVLNQQLAPAGAQLQAAQVPSTLNIMALAARNARKGGGDNGFLGLGF